MLNLKSAISSSFLALALVVGCVGEAPEGEEVEEDTASLEARGDGSGGGTGAGDGSGRRNYENCVTNFLTECLAPGRSWGTCSRAIPEACRVPSPRPRTCAETFMRECIGNGRDTRTCARVLPRVCPSR